MQNKQNNLPKYWAVKNTNNKDFKIVIDYLNKTYRSDYKGDAYNAYYGHDGNTFMFHGNNYYTELKFFKNNPTVLTLEEFKKAISIEEQFVEQFKKYVLNMQENNKKIIGYKLVKKEFETAARMLAISCNCNFNEKFDTDVKAVELWKKAGVLDLWFEPIYEEEVKTINMGSFNLTVKDKKVFHKNEDITDFVLDMSKYRILQKLGRYTARIEEINFGSTGCECNPTKLSDWLKVYDMIK